MEKRKDFKDEYFDDNGGKPSEGMKKSRTIWGVVGVLLVVLGLTGTIPLSINKIFIGLPIAALFVIGGIILIAWSVS